MKQILDDEPKALDVRDFRDQDSKLLKLVTLRAAANLMESSKRRLPSSSSFIVKKKLKKIGSSPAAADAAADATFLEDKIKQGRIFFKK